MKVPVRIQWECWPFLFSDANDGNTFMKNVDHSGRFQIEHIFIVIEKKVAVIDVTSFWKAFWVNSL